MKRVIFVLSVVFLLSGYTVFAEHDGVFGGFGYTSDVVVWHSDFSEFNNLLASAGYGKIEQFDYGFGGGGGSIINNFYIGGFGFGDVIEMQADNSSNSNYLKKSYGVGGLDFGYLLLKREGVFVIPTAGFQWGGNALKIYTATPTDTTLQGLLASPGNMTTVQSSNYSVSVSLQMGIMFGSVGLYTRIGYLFTPIEVWEISGYSGNLTGAPSMGKHAFFGLVGLVFGGMEGKKRFDFVTERKNEE